MAVNVNESSEEKSEQFFPSERSNENRGEEGSLWSVKCKKELTV